MSVKAVRQALCDTISQYAERQVYTYKVVKEQGQFPAVIVEPDEADYVGDFGGSMTTWRFNVWVLCNGADLETGQNDLDEFVDDIGPNSIPQILNTHSNLGIGAVDATVQRMKGYGGSFQWYGVPHVGALLVVDVIMPA
ncbi:hypothetical protein [Nocardia nova]|uniref:hypothetical protein n=1 Tax=Nocardia nova TaxID=37330 RepID=UPI002739F2A4|nr:hypothetical protein [Nocardia nova]